MRNALFVIALILLASATSAQEPTMMPCGAPYECAVNVRVANATATWKMTFDRRWPAIYDIVHWELVYDNGQRAEYLAQLVRPTVGRMYYRFFVHERRGTWYTLGLHRRWVWREVRRMSTEQEALALRLRQLYSNAHALQFDADPRTLRF